MKITTTDIIKNGIWLTFPLLLFSLSLMSLLPTALTSAQFNKGIPDVLLNVESIARVLVFAMPAFFSIGISTKTQKRGLALYWLE
jgi:amino acid permease